MVPEMSITIILHGKSGIVLQGGTLDYIDTDCLQNKNEKKPICSTNISAYYIMILDDRINDHRLESEHIEKKNY